MYIYPFLRLPLNYVKKKLLDALTSSPDDRRLFFWLEVQRLFYSSQLTEVRG
jgi:hypothetical protein